MADLTVRYEGNPITELSESGTKTLKTAGKYCEDDITVEYSKPAGGGTVAGRDWAELGVIDFSVISGTVKLEGLDNYTELLFLWENVKNSSTTVSGYQLLINGSALTDFDAIPIRPEGSPDYYGYTYLRYNGKFWDIRRSYRANFKSNFKLSNENALYPYNVAFNVGAATSIKLEFSGYQYVAKFGKLTIWGR